MYNINITHTLKEINYDNLTWDELVKLKIEVLSIKRQLKILYFSDSDYGDRNKLENFTNITNAAFGYLHNPYINVIRDLKSIEYYLDIFSESISEDWVLSYSSFKGKKQTFNVLFTYQGDSNLEKQKYLDTIDNFDNAQKLYNEAVKQRYAIYKKYLGFKVGFRDGKYYRYESKARNGRGRFFILEWADHNVGRPCLNSKEYGFENWNLWSSSNKIYQWDNKEVEDIFREKYPEDYV